MVRKKKKKKRLEKYGICGKNVLWLKSYHSNGKQYIEKLSFKQKTY